MSESKPEQTPEQTPDEAPAPEGAAAPEGEAPIPSMTRDADTAPEDTAPAEDDLAARVAELEAQLTETKDHMLRALAEAENVRRRAERDKQDASKYAVASFARDVLGVGDNLRRALDSIDAEARKTSDTLETLATGVEMTERELLSAMERNGIKRIDPLGQRFDSNAHEALFEIPDESKPQGTVAQVIEAGYMLHDRLLRPAKVGVTKGGPKPEPVAPAAPAGEAASGDGKAYEQGGPGAGGQVNEEL